MFFRIFLIPFFLNFYFLSVSAEEVKSTEPKRNKIEELFIWKVSDELHMSGAEEKKFTELFKDLNKKKSDIGNAQEKNLDQLLKVKSKKERDKLLRQHRKLIDDYNKLQAREFDEIKKIVGPERMVKYLTLKRDLTNKVKSLLVEKTEKKETELPPPQVIEEK